MSHKSFIQQLIMHKLEFKTPGMIEETVGKSFFGKELAMGQIEGDEDIIELAADRNSRCGDWSVYCFKFTSVMSFADRATRERDHVRYHIEGRVDSFGSISDVNLRVFHDGKPWATKFFREV